MRALTACSATGRPLEFNDPAFRGTTKPKTKTKQMNDNVPTKPRRAFPTYALPRVFWEINLHPMAQLDVLAWILVIPFERVRHG